MKINHIALRAENLELLRSFYTEYFYGISSSRYHNPKKGFTSYFITFEGDCRLELIHMDTPSTRIDNPLGLVHISFSVGSKLKVDELTEKLKHDGVAILSEPRTTGDGYYESVIVDPEGNIVEITI